jgi:ATP-binding protein involved in chromosome partitioning
MPLDQSLITEALRTVPDPAGGLDLITAGRLRHAAACDGLATVKLTAPPRSDPDTLDRLARSAHRALATLCKATHEPLVALNVEFLSDSGGSVYSTTVREGSQSAPRQAPGHQPIGGLRPQQPAPAGAHSIPGVQRIIAVGAGKGGVGKSSIAVNLAVGLARRGHAVGLLDADIYGPSMPTMLGLQVLEQSVIAGKLQPFLVHGIKCITLGKLVDPEKPLIWRGPMAHGAFKQLTDQTDWGELDYLVIDLPPGTGDISLTMAQSLALTGAVLVCTPQQVAIDDCIRAARMFEQLGIEVLGVVENMSTFIADDLSPPREYDIFGKGGAERMAKRLAVPFLGAVPLTIALRVNSDAGNPSANFEQGKQGTSPLGAALEVIAANVESQASLAAMRQGAARPTLKIS